MLVGLANDPLTGGVPHGDRVVRSAQSSEPEECVDFLVLGPLEVRVGREPVALGGPRPRAVLSDLIVHAPSVVATDRLIDDLWVDPPASAEAIVQNAVARLRKSLGPAVIETVAPGYRLTVDPGRIDARRFERLVRDARPLPARERADALRDALALWRGPVFMDLAFEPFLHVEIARLEELRLAALEDRLEAEIELGLHDAAVAELEGLAAGEPSRERLRRLQMLALHRSGRTQEALDVYERTRRAIDETAGLEPSVETKALQLMILREDPAIAPSAAVVAGAREGRRLVALVAATAMIEPGIDLEATAAIVRAVREALGDTTERHGGTVATPLGAESIAVFGAAGSEEDDVLRAGRAAIEALEILKSRGIPVRLALSVGRVLIEDGVPLLLGEVVDEVRAAAAGAPLDEIVVTASALPRGEGSFVVKEIDGHATLTGVRPGRLVRPSPPVPLVGRDGELARLDAAFESAVETSAPVHIVVVGDAGLGKTRLVADFVGRDDAAVLRAACVPYGEGITFLPLRDLAEQALLLDAGAPVPGDVSNAEAAFSDVRALLEHFLDARPVILVLDDLHWAVPTFLDLVEYLVLACRGALLVVSVTRPSLLERRPAWRDHALELEPLPASQARRLVEVADATHELAPDTVARIVETGAGRPLFVEQLVAYARETHVAPSSIPPSIEGVLTSRIDALAPGELTVLQHAAACGARFDRAALASLANQVDESALDGRLASLARSGLLHATDESFTFAHALVRDAAYEGIPKALRVSYHERIAAHIDQAGGLDGSVAAFHLETAALLSREIGSHRPDLEREAGLRLSEAGFEQWRGGDASGTVNLLGRAMAMIDRDEPLRLDVGVELSVALRAIGESAKAAMVLEETAAAARRLRQRRIERRVEVESLVPGMSAGLKPDAAWATVEGALPVFRRARDDRAVGRTLLFRAFLSSIGCRFSDSAAAAEEAFAYLERAGYDTSRATLVVAAAGVHGPLPIAEARAGCDELRDRAAGHALTRANIDLMRALIEVVAGDEARARRFHSDAVAVFEERGQRRVSLTDCAGIAAEIELMSGRLDDARAILEHAAAALELRGDSAWAARHHILRAEISCVEGDPAGALALARRATRSTPPADVHGSVTCMRVTAKAQAVAGRIVSARRLVRRALSALDGTDALELRSRVLGDAAEIERDAGNHEALRIALDQASAAASAKGSVLVERRIAVLRRELVEA